MKFSWKQRLIIFISSWLVRLFHLSYRYKVIGEEHYQEAKKMHPKGSCCFASWHQNCFPGMTCLAPLKVTLLVSPSFDGELISQSAAKIGMKSIRGSSSRGGKKALDLLIERTHEGLVSAITVDGPRGPAYLPKRGIFHLAAQTGAPIIPLMAIGESYWTAHKSWDQLRLPKPFSKVYVFWGKPMLVSMDDYNEDLNKLSDELKVRIHDLEENFAEFVEKDIYEKAKKERLKLEAKQALS